jgi:trans-2,3-dihydro-3-hydroxyanthranilate isomerase
LKEKTNLGYPIHIVDVFTDRALAGNQLAVVLDAGDITPEVMQRVAREMNFSETTFVMAPEQSGHAARVRIFTPGTELPFAGHPTVGTAWVLSTQNLVPGGALEFTLEEGVGPVPVRGERGANGLTFWMTHPPLTFGDVIADRGRIAAALGVEESDLIADVPLQAASTGNKFLYVALKDARAVDSAVSDRARLAGAFAGREPLPVFMFAAVGSNRLYSRMFSPHVFDIAEDPATGSGSGPLGAFAVRYGLVRRSNNVAIVSEQGVKMGRRSIIEIRMAYEKDGDIPTRIEVGGAVMPVVTGTLVGV